ncbi:MAG TPA: proline dehydrogenase family protein, partial [Gaiellaceae bacterium]|nr:proline dehydrogenase family protein [Gaiellaceae bacterium]
MSGRVGGAVNSGLRKVILGSSQSRPVKRVASRHGMRLGASRFVAGETLDACVEVLRGLNEKGFHANTTLLGEDVMDEAATAVVVDEYLRILGRIGAEGLRVNVAVKLTHLGLDLGEELAAANVRKVVERAAELGNFVRIDMEYFAAVDPTLRIYRRLREDGLDNVGVVLQSYLYRAPKDLEDLLPLKPNVRLVKGAYLEPPEVAHPKKEDVDAAYVAMMETSLRGEGYTAIATHDESMIDRAIALAEREGIARDRFE